MPRRMGTGPTSMLIVSYAALAVARCARVCTWANDGCKHLPHHSIQGALKGQ